jgi:hypothetical protein
MSSLLDQVKIHAIGSKKIEITKVIQSMFCSGMRQNIYIYEDAHNQLIFASVA